MKSAFLIVAWTAVACAKPALEYEATVAARPMVSAVKAGDCVEARRRAAAAPDLEVDSVPRLLKQNPRPFARMPAPVKNQVDKKGAAVKADVVIDTLGRPDMKTFKVVEASNPWLAENIRTSMPKWTFSPARLAGCKVARIYKFSATAKPRAQL